MISLLLGGLNIKVPNTKCECTYRVLIICPIPTHKHANLDTLRFKCHHLFQSVIEPELIWSQATNPTDKLEHHSLLTHSGPPQLLLRLPIDDPINWYLVKVQMSFFSFFFFAMSHFDWPINQKKNLKLQKLPQIIIIALVN
jgi:hypothetical protein